MRRRCCCCCLLPIKVTSASAASAIAIYGLDLCISATGSLMRTHRRTKQTLNTHTHVYTCTHSYSGPEYIEFICNLFHFLGLRHAANVQARNERVNREEEEARCKAMPLVYAHVCVCVSICYRVWQKLDIKS